MRQNSIELTRLLDDKSSSLITAIASKGGQFSTEIERAAETAVKAIDTKAFAFGQTMMDNSTELARIINEASSTATSIVNRSLKELQDTTSGSLTQATQAVSQTLRELQHTTTGSLAEAEHSVSQTLRQLQDFDRPRGREIEGDRRRHGVGAALDPWHGTSRHHDAARAAPRGQRPPAGGARRRPDQPRLDRAYLSARVAEFVSTIGDLLERANSTSGKMDEHISSFYGLTSKVLADLGDLATQVDGHGRSLTETVDMLEASNKHSLAAITDRHSNIEGLVNMLERAHRGPRCGSKRFPGMLEEFAHVAEDRARDIARLVAEATWRARARSPRSMTPSCSSTEEQSQRTLEVAAHRL